MGHFEHCLCLSKFQSEKICYAAQFSIYILALKRYFLRSKLSQQFITCRHADKDYTPSGPTLELEFVFPFSTELSLKNGFIWCCTTPYKTICKTYEK